MEVVRVSRLLSCGCAKLYPRIDCRHTSAGSLQTYRRWRSYDLSSADREAESQVGIRYGDGSISFFPAAFCIVPGKPFEVHFVLMFLVA